jgi:SNF2 family DNA or RNA helicase
MQWKVAFALLMAMRTGKTKVLLDDFGRLELAGMCSDLLVIAPAGVYLTWIDAIKQHLSVDLLSRVRVQAWASGANARQRRQLENFLEDHSRPRILLVNVEALSTVQLARDTCERFLDTSRRRMIAIDESTVIKQEEAKRTEYIIDKLSKKSDWRRILTGLATPKNPLDLFAQFRFLDPDILRFSNFIAFRARYAITKPVTIGVDEFYDKVAKQWRYKEKKVAQIVAWRHEDELRALIEPHSFRVPFRPKIPSTYSFRDVALTKEQARIYKELKDQATAEIEDKQFVSATTVITQMLRLHQVVCGHVKDEEGNEHELPENKTRQLLEILEDYDGKAIIWCCYDFDIRRVSAAIANRFGPRSVARFWGGNRDTREAEEHEFKTNPECRFEVATQSAGGRGRTWDGADLVIYHSSTNNLEYREQSEQRPHGVDKERQVDYIDLVARDTVEWKILEALRKKIDLATVINGDTYKEWLI